NPRVQVVLRPDPLRISERHYGRGRSERLWQEQHRGRDLVGARGAEGQLAAERPDGGRHLQRQRGSPTAGHGGGVAPLQKPAVGGSRGGAPERPRARRRSARERERQRRGGGAARGTTTGPRRSPSADRGGRRD